MKTYFQKVMYLLGEDKRKLPNLILLFILTSLLDLVGIGIIGPFLTVVFSAENEFPISWLFFNSSGALSKDQLILSLTLLILFIFTLKSFAGAVISLKIIKFSQTQQIVLRVKLISAFFDRPYTKIIDSNSSKYINSVQIMVPNFANLIMHSLQATGDLIVSFMIIALLIFANPYIFFILVSISGLILIIFDAFVRKRMLKAGQVSNESSALMIKNLSEAINGVKDIRTLQGEIFFINKLQKSAENFAKSQTNINFFSILPKYIFELIIISFITALAIFGTFFYGNPVGLIPTIGIFGMAAIRLLPVARNISFTLNRIRYSKDSIFTLFEYLASSVLPHKFLKEHGFPIEKNCKIELDSVSFKYPNSPQQALSNISFKINPGEHIGIIGESGAGKTTLLDILLGLLKPTSGHIFLNDEEITDIPEKIWQYVGYMPQEIFLIDGTIKENVALAQQEVDIDEVRLKDALMFSKLIDVVENLANGVNTNIGENGVMLSGGQRQRIALARAFYFQKKVLVLDEATSSLDTQMEEKIIKHLKKLKSKVTVISITHRHKSLESCDRIFRIEEGKLTEVKTAD